MWVEHPGHGQCTSRRQGGRPVQEETADPATEVNVSLGL